MKRFLSILLVVLILFSVSSCKPKQKIVGKYEENLQARLENMMTLQKSIFIGKVVGVTQQDALIPKYEFDITKYNVYSVEVTKSLDGYTPLGTILVYCAGTPEQFANRISPRKNETYIFDADPWIYDGKLIYLLSVYTAAYPRIDVSGNVTVEISDTELLDIGPQQNYIKKHTAAKDALKEKNPNFFSPKETLERYISMFENIRSVNANNWFRDHAYDWKPTEAMIQSTRDYTDKVYNYLISLKDKVDLNENDIKKIFTGV